jgi:hypothetical protein
LSSPPRRVADQDQSFAVVGTRPNTSREAIALTERGLRLQACCLIFEATFIVLNLAAGLTSILSTLRLTQKTVLSAARLIDQKAAKIGIGSGHSDAKECLVL